MPYIEKDFREMIDDTYLTTGDGLNSFLNKMAALDDDVSKNPGVLNYIITKIIYWWLGWLPNYNKYNSVIGVLESIKLELYRKSIQHYEDEKIQLNGDVGVNSHTKNKQ